MNVKTTLVVSSICFLQACSTVPKHSLLPEDIPTLYSAPALQQVGEQAKLKLEDAASAELDAVQGHIDHTLEQANSALAPAQLEVASLSPAIAALSSDAVEQADPLDKCAAIAAEIATIDAGLGEPAEEKPPAPPPTTAQKIGRSFYDIAVQSILGPVQVVIQTKRAIFGDAEKERRGAEALERGTTRRAYLMGYAGAENCDLVPATTVPAASE